MIVTIEYSGDYGEFTVDTDAVTKRVPLSAKLDLLNKIDEFTNNNKFGSILIEFHPDEGIAVESDYI